jgi:branched-chain amino acid transport system substrate-binding protein
MFILEVAMRKMNLTLVGLLTIGLMISGCDKSDKGASPVMPVASSTNTIKIGVAIPETGVLAAFMVWFKTGIVQAVDEINSSGGIDGKQVEIIYGDVGARDGSIGKQRLTELKERGCVAFIAHAEDGAMQWAVENKKPVILYSNTSTQETIVNYNKYAFFTGLNAWGMAKAIATETAGKQGFNSFVFVGVDEACTVDAENLLIFEGKKLNPKFHMIASYRMGWDDDKFATIVSTIMSLPEQPDMILQQGGGPNFVSFAQQASLYGLFEYCDVYNELPTNVGTASSLVEAGTYPYGEIHGLSLLQWWETDNPEIQAYTDAYHKASLKLGDTVLEPSDPACYLGTLAILKAVRYCVDNNMDYNDGDVMADAITKISWTSFAGEHKFRDFDHTLTYDVYFVTSADGGEKFSHYPIGANAQKLTADQYLPTLEDMKIYAREIGYPDRFK